MPLVSRIVIISIAASACFGLRAQEASPERATRQVLDAQQAAWNRGDVEGFMSGYEASDETTFVGATITRGHRQGPQKDANRHPPKEKKGALTFSGVERKPPGPDVRSGTCTGRRGR